jgi:hypothetical protein
MKTAKQVRNLSESKNSLKPQHIVVGATQKVQP